MDLNIQGLPTSRYLVSPVDSHFTMLCDHELLSIAEQRRRGMSRIEDLFNDFAV